MSYYTGGILILHWRKPPPFWEFVKEPEKIFWPRNFDKMSFAWTIFSMATRWIQGKYEACARESRPGGKNTRRLVHAVFLHFFAALRANAIQIMGMAGECEIVFAGYFLLQAFDARIAYFHYFSAMQANQVIMVGIGPGHFITGQVVAELDFGREASLAEKL